MAAAELGSGLLLAALLAVARSVNLSYDPRSDCGRVEVQCPVIATRIVGGDIWCAERMPYNVLIEYVVKDPRGGRIGGVRVHGGGSIITERHILTAAHVLFGNTVQTRTGTRICPSEFRKKTSDDCLGESCPPGCLRIHPSQLKVYAGVTNRTSLSRSIRVKEIFVHHGWNGNSPDNDIGKGHDIAILELERSLAFSPRVWPICLPDPTDQFLAQKDRSVFVGGFGRNSAGEIPDLLQHAQLRIKDNAECRRLWQDPRGGDRITGSQICALGDRRNDGSLRADTCQGDSGSALITVLGDRPFQIGITSFGDPNCGASINPGVYTNVIDHMAWINSVIQNGQCKTTENPPRKCVFPFKFDGRTFFSCTTYSDPNGEAWCSVKVDSEGNHIVGEGEWGFCQSTCVSGTSSGTSGGTTGGSSSPQIQDSAWTSWSQCSATCKGGTRRRTRASCPVSESSSCILSQDQPCNANKQCPAAARPVNCLKEWSEWSVCSVSCGQGTRERFTKVVRKASNGGRTCSRQTKKQSTRCNQQDCPSQTVTQILGSWGQWSPCTVTCGDGSRSRQRSCTGGSSCSALNIETQNCRINCRTNNPQSARRKVIRLDQPAAPGESKCRCSCKDHFHKIEDDVNNHFGQGRFNCLSFERGDPFCYIDANSCSDTKWYKSYWSNEACRGFERGGPDYTVCCGNECYTKGDYRRKDFTGRITGAQGQYYQFDPWDANDRPVNGSFVWPNK